MTSTEIDIELEYLRSLLSAKRAEQRETMTSGAYRIGLFKIRGAEAHWVHNQWKANGVLPSLAAFNDRFNLALNRKCLPLQSALKPLMDRYNYEVLREHFSKVNEMLEQGLEMNEVFSKYVQLATEARPVASGLDKRLTGAMGSSLERYIHDVRTAADGKQIFFTTQWKSLNRLIGGFKPKESCVLASRPSLGKTWVVVTMANHWALEGRKVLFFSLEMSADTLEDRLACMRYGLNYEAFRMRKLPPIVLREYKKKIAQGEKSPMSYDLTLVTDSTLLHGSSVAYVEQTIEEIKPDIVILDGAYLLRPDYLQKNATDVQRFSEISRLSRIWAKRYSSFVLSVIQFNREAENENKREVKSSLGRLYGADAFAQDADWVLGIGGKRGAPLRTLDLLKGRESAIGELAIKFSLSPPDFSEASGVSGDVTYQSIVPEHLKGPSK